MNCTIVDGPQRSNYFNNNGISCDGHSWGTSRKSVLYKKKFSMFH